MARIKIEQRIRVYERNGEEIGVPAAEETIGINAHWNDGHMIVLVIENQGLFQSYTVFGPDILVAIANAMNSGE